MNKTKILVIGGVVLLFTIGVGYFLMQNSASKQNAGTAGKSAAIDSSAVGAGTTCSKQYENILAKYQQNFDECRLNVTKASSCDKDPNVTTDPKQKNIVIVFDSSGSMNQVVGGKKKIDVAKDSVAGFLRDIDKNTNVSIVLYGHKGGNSQSAKKVSCAGIDEVYYLGSVNPDIAIAKLTGAKPTGWTPIAASLQKAGDILKNYPADKNDNMVLLVSDGEEACDGDPVAKAKELLGTNAKILTNVIGFDVAGAAEQKLQAIAGAGGKYFSVHNEEEFKTAFKENKNFMVGFDCYMEQSGVWLDNQLNTEFMRNDCMNKLDMEEKHELTLNANLLDDGVTADCRDFVLSEYQKRYDQIKSEIEQRYSANKSDTEAQKKKLEDTRNNLDAGEDALIPE
ncbi:MAG: VWA domain-containing protein [Candidatus Moranbacteria bacterium]|nr:VWA domain-containing protein [Candidatus Moranbacteria bacterium]